MNISKEHIGKSYLCFKNIQEANQNKKIKEIITIYGDIRGYL